MATRSRRTLAVGAVLIAAALGLLGLRARAQSWLIADRAGDPAPPWPPVAGRGLAPAPRLRVILVNGLGLAPARRLEALNALCASGIDLVVNAGFPTVSLPVQRVLWTGQTQQQSGVRLGNQRRVVPPGAIPARVPGSVAVVESHPQIAGSFGFGRLLEPPAADFEATAAGALRGDARLVFVHVLRVDAAGHRAGAASSAYARAAAEADAMLARWRATAGPGERWIVLADHGHLPGGGHKGSEPAVRLVRACVAGVLDGWRGPRAGRIHLVDLSRALADSLGLAPMPPAAGRPLAVAIADPRPGATLPRVTPARWGAAAALLAVALALTVLVARRRPWSYPWWIAVAGGTLLAAVGLPSLSSLPRGLALAAAGAPGAALLALATWRELGRGADPLRLAAAQLALPLALVAAALVAAGGPAAVVPHVTAAAVELSALLAIGCGVSGLVTAVAGARPAAPL